MTTTQHKLVRKRIKQRAKRDRHIKRLVARLTVLNAQVPTTEYQRRMWQQQRETIMRQLQRYGISAE